MRYTTARMTHERIEYKPRDWTKTPLLGKQILEFEELTRLEGLPSAAGEILARRGIFVTHICEPKETFETLSDQPVLVIAEHPQHDLDGIAVLSGLPKERDDTFVLASAGFLGFPPHLKEHIIPIYATAKKETNSLRLKIWRGLKLDPPPPPDSKRRNLESLEKAAQAINNEHIVVIFPEAANGSWQSGLAFLAKRVLNTEVRIVFASIYGTDALDKWRILPQAKLLLPPTNVALSFSMPYLFSDFTQLSQGLKGMVVKMKDEYDQFKEESKARLRLS